MTRGLGFEVVSSKDNEPNKILVSTFLTLVNRIRAKYVQTD
jgi:hypothetical protein